MKLRVRTVVALALALAPGAVACSSSDSAPAAAPADLPGVGEHDAKLVSAASGGTVSGTGVSVAIPPGALAADATITIDIKSRTGMPAADTLAVNVFELGPNGTQFQAPVPLTFDLYGQSAPSGKVAKIAYLDGTTWKTLDDSTVAGGKVTASTTHFTPFTIVWTPDGSFGTPGGCASFDFTPCGGDPTGTWTFDGACADSASATGANPFVPSGTSCPGASGTTTVDFTGTFAFNSDSTFAVTGSMTGGVVYTVPKSCYPAGTSCASMFPGGGDAGPVVTDDGTNCVFNLGGQQNDNTSSGTWRASGTGLYTTDTGKSETGPIDYCVQGNTMRLKQAITQSGDAGASAGTFYFTLKR